jgi:hypothetical protein
MDLLVEVAALFRVHLISTSDAGDGRAVLAGRVSIQ